MSSTDSCLSPYTGKLRVLPVLRDGKQAIYNLRRALQEREMSKIEALVAELIEENEVFRNLSEYLQNECWKLQFSCVKQQTQSFNPPKTEEPEIQKTAKEIYVLRQKLNSERKARERVQRERDHFESELEKLKLALKQVEAMKKQIVFQKDKLLEIEQENIKFQKLLDEKIKENQQLEEFFKVLKQKSSCEPKTRTREEIENLKKQHQKEMNIQIQINKELTEELDHLKKDSAILFSLICLKEGRIRQLERADDSKKHLIGACLEKLKNQGNEQFDTLLEIISSFEGKLNEYEEKENRRRYCALIRSETEYFELPSKPFNLAQSPQVELTI